MKNHLLIILLSLLCCTATAQDIFVKNEKYGVKDSLGNVITKPKYDHIEEFENTVSITRLKDKYGIISNKGIELVAPIYQEIKPISFFSDNIDVRLGDKWGVLDLQGKELIAPKYYEAVDMNFFADYTVVSLATATVVSSGEAAAIRYGAINNETYKEIISPKYFFLKSQNFGYFIARTDEKYKKYGLIDTDEKVIFPLEYENIFAASKDIIAYEKNGKFVLVNSKGYSISSAEYDEIYRMSDKRAKVRRNGKFGFIDEKGKEVIACQYDDSEDLFYEGKVKVELDGAKFEIDANGNEVTVSETIKPRTSLVFYDDEDKTAFDLINFKDDVSSSENLKLVDDFLGTKRSYVEVIEYVDNLISEAANNKLAYKEFTNYLYAKYSNSEYACFDAIPIHVSQTYMCNSDAPYGGGYWLGAENKKEICDYGIKHKSSLCGEVVSDVQIKLLPQTNTKYFHLEDVQSKYTLLFFWQKDCSYCEEQSQVLASNYAELKDLGVEIIGISSNYQDKDKAEQLIVSNGMDWINTVDLNHKIINKLNVTNMPFLFLLDKDKKIIIKAISAEQTINYLKRL